MFDDILVFNLIMMCVYIYIYIFNIALEILKMQKSLLAIASSSKPLVLMAAFTSLAFSYLFFLGGVFDRASFGTMHVSDNLSLDIYLSIYLLRIDI